MVGLRYERLPEFCYACGRIGHGIKACPDSEARIAALQGRSTKFGPWMRALVVDRLKERYHKRLDGISASRDRFQDGKGVINQEASIESNFGMQNFQLGMIKNIESVSDKKA